MTDDKLLPFCFPAVCRKKITASFDGGRISSDGGVMLLAQADRRLGIAERLAQAIPDARDPDRITHLLPDILRARIFAIACGYEDADDLDRLRFDPAFKLACGRLPDSGRNLCSQPTVSRFENAPDTRALIRLMGVMVDLYCASYTKPPAAVTLDIDDTVASCTATSNSRCSTPTTTSAASCRSTSMTRQRAGRSLCCCALARRPQAPRSAVTCAVSSIAFAGTGRRPASRSEAMAITLARRSWRVRREWYRLHLRSARQHRARPAGRCDGRRHSHPPRARPEALPARLRRDKLPGEILAYRPARLCPDRGHHKGPRYPFRRHQHRDRVGRAYLPDALLRPRPGRESDQIAQGAAGLRSHQLPQPARQSNAVDPAHRRLLAHAHRS